ncbi:MAG: hypothetical protein U1E74_03805 [Paenacidovorax caeni]
MAALHDFYRQLWQGIAERRNDGSDIAAEIGAFESDVGVLYDDYRQSEFASVKDYVAFYEQVGENPYFDAQESVKRNWCSSSPRPAGARAPGCGRCKPEYRLARFLALMAQRGDSFAVYRASIQDGKFQWAGRFCRGLREFASNQNTNQGQSLEAGGWFLYPQSIMDVLDGRFSIDLFRSGSKGGIHHFPSRCPSIYLPGHQLG